MPLHVSRERPRRAFGVAFSVLLAVTAFARPLAAQTVLPPPGDVDAGGEPDTVWQQLLMAPRITGNLRAVAVDPTDPMNIYVGTEEGTLAHSSDGGVTWEEIELSPFLMRSPTVQIAMSGDDYKAMDVFAGFTARVGTFVQPFSPLFRRSSGTGMPLVAPPFLDVAPYFLRPFRFTDTPEPLLNTVSEDPKPYEEIRRVRICPGGSRTIFVATDDRLWGSSDAVTFVQLFVSRDKIEDVACSPADPNDVILTTGDGTYQSTNGGSTFDQMGGVVGPAASKALAFAPPGEAGKELVFIAAGRDLWIGDPNSPETMRVVSLAGEGDLEVRHVIATAKSVWVATAAGVRVSHDRGATWSSIEDLEGFAWDMIAAESPPAGGPEHVVVLGETIAFESTDGGVVFHPSFRAQSRRRLRQVVALPATEGAESAFLLVTSGELWTSKAPAEGQGVRVNDANVRRWAERRLRTMPTLSETIDRALLKAGIAPVQVEAMASALKTRAWLPGMTATFAFARADSISLSRASVTDPTVTAVGTAFQRYGVFLDLVWELPDLISPVRQFEPVKARLYDLRKRFSFVIEDAYDERKQVLAELVTGRLDAEQVLVLQTRAEALDTVIAQFTGESPPR